MTQPPNTQPPTGPPQEPSTTEGSSDPKQETAQSAQETAQSAQETAQSAQETAQSAQESAGSSSSDSEPTPGSDQPSEEKEESSDEGPIKARFGPSAPESRVVLSEEERAASEHLQRAMHNERTGGGPVQEGELQDAREKHLRRTAGIPDEEESESEAPTE